MGGFAILVIVVVVGLSNQVGGVFSGNERSRGRCDVYEGKWVEDESYPLYDISNCPFIEKEFDCLHNHRPDKHYLKFRWQPTNCNLPRSENEMANAMQEYDAKVMLSRNAFLVDIVSTVKGRVLKLDSIQSGHLWKGIDVLIFNSWHWWLHTGRKQPWDLIEEGNRTYKDMDRLVGFEKALNTWAKWIDTNVHPSQTRVLFQGVSPDHMNGSNWGEPKARNCGGQTQPFVGQRYPGGKHPAEEVVERVIGRMSNAVYLLNVTTLSQFRKDGHPSVFGHGGHSDMDCSHWCLPGVPDTWNLLFYYALSFS